MTLHDLYYQAATLRLAHELANARTTALDTITCRHIMRGCPHESTACLLTPCRCNTCNWRRCGSRAARVTMDRGYVAMVARLEARERMLAEIPWRVPPYEEGRRGS